MDELHPGYFQNWVIGKPASCLDLVIKNEDIIDELEEAMNNTIDIYSCCTVQDVNAAFSIRGSAEDSSWAWVTHVHLYYEYVDSGVKINFPKPVVWRPSDEL